MATLQKSVRATLEQTKMTLEEGLKALEKFQGLARPTEWPNGASYSLRNPRVKETTSNIKHDHSVVNA